MTFEEMEKELAMTNSVEKDVVLNVVKFVIDNHKALEDHYFDVIDKDALPERKVIDKHIYEYIDLSTYLSELTKVSVVILTANFFECQILNYNVFKDYGLKIQKLIDGINLFRKKYFRVIDAYIMKINEYTILHLHAPETGSNTPCGSMDLVRYVCSNKYLHPTCIISFGICYGINYRENSLGDTLIANKIYPYSVGLKIKDGDWNIKCDDYILNLRECNANMYKKIDEVISGEKNSCPQIRFSKAITCNMITGEAVVSDENFKQESIEKAHGFDIKGGEMEGYGLAKECIYYGDIDCIILKSICDWGACKNIDLYIKKFFVEKSICDYKGQIQAYTAYCAYTVLKKLFHESIFSRKNLYDDVKEYIIKTYLSDAYLQSEFLEKGIIEFLKCNEMIDETVTPESMRVLIKSIVNHMLNDQIFRENITEGILGYVFII